MPNGMVVDTPLRSLARRPFGTVANLYPYARAAGKFIYHNSKFGNGRSSFVNAGSQAHLRRYGPYPSPLRGGGRAAPKSLPRSVPSKRKVKSVSAGQRLMASGFMKAKPRRKSKFRRKKGRKSGKGKANFINGVQQRIEATQKVQDLQCVYVGHSTMAAITVHKQICLAIAKALLNKEGFSPVSVTETQNVNVATKIQILYYANATSITTTTLSFNIPANSALQLYADAVELLMSAAIAAYDRKVNFTKFRFISDNTAGGDYRFYHEFNMNAFMLDGWMRSQINMQNATPSALKSSNIDVNNANPVRVTIYEGNGNGTFWRNRTETSASFQNFLGDEAAGTIAVVANEANNRVLDEPPNSKFFISAKKSGGFILQPGEIKSSKLFTPIHMSIVKYIESYQGYEPLTPDLMSKLGKFRFYGIEKVLTTNLAGSLPSDVKVQIDYEVDYATCFKATLKKSFSPTAPINTTLIIADKG